jgi:radical SAM protein with 4Fe4S-binding SPASM domain
VRKAQVSIYSADAALHEAITRAPGSFARSIRAIRLLRESGLEVTMACALMRGNAGGYRGLRALAEELGVHLLLDPTITPRLNGDLGPLALRTPAPDLVPLLADPKMNGAGKTSELPGSRPDPHRLEACATADPYRSVPCSAGRNSVYISPFGDVYPCVQMPVSAGNLRKQSFTEIWHESRQMKEVRSVNASSVRVCSACAIRRYCQRCPGLALMEDGDMAGPSLRACELAEQRAHLAGLDNPVSPYRIRKTTAGAGQQNDGNFGLEISDCGFQAPASLEIRNPKSEIRNSCD